MKKIKELEYHEYSYGESRMADKVNELVRAVNNKLNKPVETTNGQPEFSNDEINRIIFAMNNLPTRPLIDTQIISKLKRLKV